VNSDTKLFPDILLVPGLMCDDYVWGPLIDSLERQAIVPNLTTQHSITQMASDCLALSSGPVVVAGHSMGARVAMEMAHLAPQRVSRLVLLDTGIHPLAEGELEKREEVISVSRDQGMEALADRWIPGMVWQHNQINETLMTQLRKMVLRHTPEQHERQIRALIDRPDASAYLAEITCPTLIVVGRYDNWSPVSQHEDMLALLPNAQLEIIENAGHFAPLEQPALVAELVADFLQRD
jgi:pimeloyl-ACP methyl ester carboxylesterase